ncbi:carbohydrate ABC transporter permease [Paenibacillus sp. IB182496]|uniref:Carbohydrate ABC transporter permease n=2 Tax=Paenibacillus sabuli TaxID=2772509 RepID=A0A927BNM5_9BACL|nr:carbohydrate ABC transporter permease [Paenibacillus sabuli]
MLIVISISFSNEQDIVRDGYRLFPENFEWTAYQIVFANPEQILNAYVVTTIQAVLGTLLSVLIMSLCAYALSRQNFKWRKPITLFIFFTMLFGGGLIPTYILITQYLHLGNTIWVYILPSLANAFYIIIFRTFFQGLPHDLVESAKMDGAGELRIYFTIMLPLSKPVLASLAFMTLVNKWNDWFTALVYVRDNKLYTLQYLLQRILKESEFIKQMSRDMPENINLGSFDLPTETVRFAMAIVAAGPVMVIFPWFQKYFARGLTIGAVKG